jgi:hypothetical protein
MDLPSRHEAETERLLCSAHVATSVRARRSVARGRARAGLRPRVSSRRGGGYYDSGYVQPIDFFGDGTRIPMIVVSPYTRAGHISHDYGDHLGHGGR